MEMHRKRAKVGASFGATLCPVDSCALNDGASDLDGERTEKY